jgi:hypothetical protein
VKPYLQNNQRAGGVAEAIVWLPSNHRALSSNPSTTKKKKSKEQKEVASEFIPRKFLPSMSLSSPTHSFYPTSITSCPIRVERLISKFISHFYSWPRIKVSFMLSLVLVVPERKRTQFRGKTGNTPLVMTSCHVRE